MKSILSAICISVVAWSYSAFGATPAMSRPIKEPCWVTIEASSTTEKRYWNVIVQTKNLNTGERRLLGVYSFGRAQDPMKYAPQKVRLSELDNPTQIEIYWKDNTDINGPVSDLDGTKWNQAIRFDQNLNSKGFPTHIYATFWDREDDKSAEIHKVTLDFDYSQL